VDEVEVYVIELQSFQGGVDGSGDVRDVIDDFGGDEEVFAPNDPELGFSVVELSPVEVVISQLDCGLDRVNRALIYFVEITRLEQRRTGAIANPRDVSTCMYVLNHAIVPRA
jgi:hypothetical protein